jgi:hypothetical protein
MFTPDTDFFSIPDPTVKKAPDPGFGSATLETGIFLYVRYGMSATSQYHIVSVISEFN